MKTFTKVCAEVLENYKRLNSIKDADILVMTMSAKELLDRAVRLYEAECAKSAQTCADDANPILAEQLWDVYAEAVGGKTFDGKPLPEFSKLGTQQTGWFEVADAVNAKLGFKLSKSETAPISAKPEPVDEPVYMPDIKFKELYIFGLNAGKDGKGTLKFVNGEITVKSLHPSSDTLEFTYTSASTGEVRHAPAFLKSNIIGCSYTKAN